METLPAIRTRERTGIAVNQQMSRQGWGTLERLVTNMTLEGLEISEFFTTQFYRPSHTICREKQMKYWSYGSCGSLGGESKVQLINQVIGIWKTYSVVISRHDMVRKDMQVNCRLHTKAGTLSFPWALRCWPREAAWPNVLWHMSQLKVGRLGLTWICVESDGDQI